MVGRRRGVEERWITPGREGVDIAWRDRTGSPQLRPRCDRAINARWIGPGTRYAQQKRRLKPADQALCQHPQRDSNPCCRLERAVS
jgi:hypothetical protein